MTTIAVLGVGEAGGLIAADLIAKGVIVNGYDPKPVLMPDGVIHCQTPQEAVARADAVIAVTPGSDADTAMRQCIDDLAPHAFYADFSTNAPSVKRELAGLAEAHGIPFVDVALMTLVPGHGLYTPVMVAGTAAESFKEVFSALGMPVETVAGEAGEAAARKLLRSVMMKGLAAVVIESMRAGEAAGCADWLWQNLSQQIASATEETVGRLVAGTATHAVRRLHEMECSQAMLESLGVDPLMTRSTVESLRRVPHVGVPAIPGSDCEKTTI